jgi:hypothetical protein
MTTKFTVTYNTDAGARLTCMLGEITLRDVPVRVRLRGSHVFSVWGVVDSGEEAPVWAEPDLDLVAFAGAAETPGMPVTVRAVADGFDLTAVHVRVAVTLTLRLIDGALTAALAVHNPQGAGGTSFPLCFAELRLEDLTVGEGADFLCAHPYGGRTHGHGAVASLRGPGVSFVHGCIGQALPVTYLHHPDGRGLEFEFMLDERPICWLRPGHTPAHAHWCVTWHTDRLLAPGQTHAYGGALRLTGYAGDAVAQLRAWRDAAAERYGLRSPETPAWARRANIIEFNMNPDNTEHAFTRLDDPRCRETLARWKAQGYTAIFAVSDNHVGINWLSPLDYDPCEAVGGEVGERQMLAWAHELGFRIFLWVTTVGIDRNAPEVAAHPDWFTHRRDGSLFYAWDSTPENGYVGYAPDGDPLSAGWRGWLKAQVRRVIGRGYDGVFIDGCIPRASNHARWAWPGESRNGVEDQVRELAAMLRELGGDLITFVEDESLAMQASCELTAGRYHAAPPFFKKAYWDHGMGGGPEAQIDPPSRIPPEVARDYLRIRYASLLPGTVTNDIVEGYISEAVRPWVVQSLLAGTVPKTHSNYLATPETYLAIDADEPPAAERAPAHRLRGTEEFLTLMRFCRDEPLVRDTARSIDGVVVEGDAAVVGILRPTPERCLLTLIQFADRPATVQVSLAEPVDIPACERAGVGEPARTAWTARELLHSMVETDAAPGTLPMTVTLGPYGFRIFELVRRGV